MQRLREYLNTKQLKQRYQDCLDPVEAKRWYLLWQVSLSKTVKQVALEMDIDYDYALSIVRRYNRCGPEILKDYRKLSWKSKQILSQEIRKTNTNFSKNLTSFRIF